MPNIYNILPPPIEEMDEVLAFIYTGPCKPTKADFKCTPMLVRHLKVPKALYWLKLNHVNYYNCEISEKNLASYPENGPPVQSQTNKACLFCSHEYSFLGHDRNTPGGIQMLANLY